MNIKEQILRVLSNTIQCPNCTDGNLNIGNANIDFSSIPVLFCNNCLYKITILMIENESNIARANEQTIIHKDNNGDKIIKGLENINIKQADEIERLNNVIKQMCSKISSALYYVK